MAQVVETKRLETGDVSRALEAAAECRRVLAPSEATREDVVIGSRELAATAQAIESSSGLVGKGDFARTA